MIKLIYEKLDTTIEFSNPINTIIWESQRVFAAAIGDMSESLDGNDDKFRFSQDGEGVKAATVAEMLIDFQNFDGNLKRANSALLKKLAVQIQGNDYGYEIEELFSKGYAVVGRLAGDYDFGINLNEVCDTNAILKLYNPSIVLEANSLLSKLIDFTNVITEFCSTKILILVNAKSYLEREEMEQFVKHCEYKDLFVLCLESHESYKLQNERIVLIDKDLCELIV